MAHMLLSLPCFKIEDAVRTEPCLGLPFQSLGV